MEELARHIQSYIHAYSDAFYTGSRRAGDALVPSSRRHDARQIKDFKETEPAQRRFSGWWNAGGAAGDGAAAEGKVQAPGAFGWTWQS